MLSRLPSTSVTLVSGEDRLLLLSPYMKIPFATNLETQSLNISKSKESNFSQGERKEKVLTPKGKKKPEQPEKPSAWPSSRPGPQKGAVPGVGPTTGSGSGHWHREQARKLTGAAGGQDRTPDWRRLRMPPKPHSPAGALSPDRTTACTRSGRVCRATYWQHRRPGPSICKQHQFNTL